MFKLFIIFALVATAAANGYGKSGGSYGGSYGGGAGRSGSSAGFSGGSRFGGSNLGGANLGGINLGTLQNVAAAVSTKHQVSFVDVPTVQNLNPATIEIGSSQLPVTIVFRSSSSSLNVQQAHEGASGTVQETSSEDEPHRLLHRVTKPIIQEVHEVIQPMRKIQQEILPVQEEVLTVVARDQTGFGSGSGSSAFGGSGSSAFGGSGSSAFGSSFASGASAGAGAGKYGGSSGSTVIVTGKSKGGY